MSDWPRGRSYLEFRFPDGFVLSGFFRDDEVEDFQLNGAETSQTLVEQLADRVRRQRSVKWSTMPSAAAIEFHRPDET